ncbi:hypothetical protein ACWCQW_26320 [Streptomyces mirabilis]
MLLRLRHPVDVVVAVDQQLDGAFLQLGQLAQSLPRPALHLPDQIVAELGAALAG